jgi:hypothetical protein
MAQQIEDAPVRAQLHTDIQAAWTGSDAVKKIHDDEPKLPKTRDDLPCAVVLLTGFRQQRAGLIKVAQFLTYEITYAAPWPTSGATLASEKIRLANLLLALLTSNPFYGGAADRFVPSGTFTKGLTEDKEPYFEFTLTFEATNIVNA